MKKAILIILFFELCSFLYIYIEKEDSNGYSIRKIRNLLIGKFENSDELPFFLSQPNLTFTNYPLKTQNQKVLINEHGYRGDVLKVKKNKDFIRVLFLGESTTFGYKVDDNSTYVKILEEKFKSEYKTEFINGGILGASSSEVLSNYVFKFQYYDPDIVVIKTGLNELDLFMFENYQPDYTNFRNNNFNIKILPPIGRLLLKSNLLSIIYIKFFVDEYYTYGFILSNENNAYNKSIQWFDNDINIMNEIYKNDYKYLAYYNNLKNLIKLVQHKEIILVHNNYNEDFVLEEKNQNWEFYKKMIAEYNSIITQLANEYELQLISIPNDSIESKLYFDDCHFNEVGHEIYASYYHDFLKTSFNKVNQKLNKNKE